MAPDANTDLRDSVREAATDAVTLESAVDAIAEPTAFAPDDDLDDDSETGENNETKEVDHG